MTPNIKENHTLPTTTDVGDVVVVNKPLCVNQLRAGIAKDFDPKDLANALMETQFGVATDFNPKDLDDALIMETPSKWVIV